MIFWLIVGVMTAVALTVVVLPIVRRPREGANRAAYNLTIYKDQLKELESDFARGLIGAQETEAARLEIERRMLAVAEAEQSDDATAHAPSRAMRMRRNIGLALIGAGVPAVAIALYLAWGSPGAPSRPFAESEQTQTAMNSRTVETAVANLLRRLEANPEDLEGWILLGRSYVVLKRFPEAVEVLRRAEALSQGDPNILAALGEAIVFAHDGIVVPEARNAFEAVLATSPQDGAARFYIGLWHSQSGRVQEAFDVWMALAADTPADASWRGDLEHRIRQAAGQLDIEIAAIPHAPAASATEPGPTQEDVAAAGEMSAEERSDMIRGMVEGLAERLRDEPDDLDGWLRLGRSYAMLRQPEKAREAYGRAAALAPEDLDVQALYARAVIESAPDTDPVPAEAVNILRNVLERDAENPQALWFLGVSEAVAGNADVARGFWQRLLKLLPEGSEDRHTVERALDTL